MVKTAAREVRSEWKRQKANCEEKEKQLRAVISPLMEVLESNRELIRAARTTALSQREQIEQSGRNLKRLQNSYVLSRSSSWTSLS